MKSTNLVISTQTLIAALIIGSFIWLLWLIQSVIIALFIAMILALAIEPFVNWFVSKKIPHGLAVLVVVMTFLVVLVGLGSVAVSPLISQFQVLSSQFPKYLNSLGALVGTPDFAEKFNSALFEQFSQATGNVITVTIDAFSGVLTLLTVFIFTVYILLDFDNLRQLFVSSFPKQRTEDIQGLVSNIESTLGSWLRGQAILMVVVGSVTYIGLLILGVDSALALAVIAGLLEIVPIIGPIIAMIPALIIAFVMNPLTGFAVIGLYILIQQLENNLLVPKVMQKAVGFNPLVTIIALLVGGKLLGVIGALIAIPVVIVLVEVGKYVLNLESLHFTKSPRTAG